MTDLNIKLDGTITINGRIVGSYTTESDHIVVKIDDVNDRDAAKAFWAAASWEVWDVCGTLLVSP